MKLSRRQKQVLRMLAQEQDGDALNRAVLKTSFHFMQMMWFEKLVDGYAHKDDKGWGNYPHTNFWYITKHGRKVLEEA